MPIRKIQIKIIQNPWDLLIKFYTGFSESRLRHQAQLWVLFIGDVIDKERNIGILNKKNLALLKIVEQHKNEITVLQKKNETKKNIDLIVSLQQTVAEQKEEIAQLQEHIEKLKRVDLGIEEEKQKILQQNESLEEKNDGEDPGS